MEKTIAIVFKFCGCCFAWFYSGIDLLYLCFYKVSNDSYLLFLDAATMLCETLIYVVFIANKY
jgi:hypothetical protein